MNRRKFIHRTLAATSATLLAGKVAGASNKRTPHGKVIAGAPFTSFPTDGHTIYQLKPAAVGAGDAARAIYCAAYDGTVLCLTQQGVLLWKTKPSAGFPFDLASGDIDADGFDEALVASSDGGLYAIDHDGRHLWTFKREAPLYQVIVRNEAGGPRIQTGGIERVLYTLATDGSIVAQEKRDRVIRRLGASGAQIKSRCKPFRVRPYLTTYASHVKSDTLGDEFLLSLYGRNLMIANSDGSCRKVLYGTTVAAGAVFDPRTNTYWIGSDISGGDGIHGFHLDHPGWQDAFTNLRPVGTMIELEQNLAALAQQTEAFKALPYQKPAGRTMVLLEECIDWDYRKTYDAIRREYLERHGLKNVFFVPYVYSHESVFFFKEAYDPGIADPAKLAAWTREHNRMGHRMLKQAEILRFAAEREAAGEPFFIYAGHGRITGIDFYLSPDTLARMLVLAPTTLQGFVFAEFETIDDNMALAIREQLLPLADLCHERGKKILLRGKNIFWNGSVYADVFKPLMSEEKYREVFVPSMEETNSRNQSLSLTGRTGLWLTKKFNHMSGRAVTDNGNFNRLWDWCQSAHLSHFVRAMILARCQGADIFHLNIYSDNAGEMLPFYQMLEKGILPLPAREDILSISDLAIGMLQPDQDFLRHGINGHGMDLYSPGEAPFVFDRLDCFWGGAMLADHDFENYALHAKRRMTNFISRSPYGNLAMIPADTDLARFPIFKRKLLTDGRYWYDDAGRRHTAPEYKPVVLQALEEAAARLPIRVTGDVAWAALRLDATHIRVVVIDPGYFDPAPRQAIVRFQHVKPTEIRDILDGAKLTAEVEGLALNIPMGSLRIIDVAHQQPDAERLT
ncbi:MAG: hypothetical protein HS122_14870 [Opitutaceae bacterium]|nr:hypothetical protein [Opitutaceae bacterium]